ncbi:MAG TPA: integrin alpha, partial [Planctomycetota bacterium]|nr:integrin alpha [Planctomycetota bacterium]
EFALGEPGLEVGSPFSIIDAGGCRVYSGATQNLLVEVTGTGGSEGLGSSICTLGDSDADGKLEFAVGGPGWSSGKGRVTVYEGKTATVVTTLLGWDLASEDHFGAAVGPAGDLDKDGHDDLIVLAHAISSPISSGYGRALSGADWSLFSINFPGLPGSGLGTSLASGFDISGDGWPDAVVGLPNASLGEDAGFVRGYDFVSHAGDMGVPAFGPVTLDIYGTKMFPGGQADLLVTGAPPNKPVYLMASLHQMPLPFKGGTIVPDMSVGLVFALPADAGGRVFIPGIPGGAPAVTAIYVQAAMKSIDAPQGWWLTNAVFVNFYP